MNVYAEDFDLKAALGDDPDGMVLKAVREALDEGRRKVRRNMDQGLSPAEYALADNLHKAYQSAHALVEQYWSQPKN